MSILYTMMNDMSIPYLRRTTSKWVAVLRYRQTLHPLLLLLMTMCGLSRLPASHRPCVQDRLPTCVFLSVSVTPRVFPTVQRVCRVPFTVTIVYHIKPQKSIPRFRRTTSNGAAAAARIIRMVQGYAPRLRRDVHHTGLPALAARY